MKKTVRERAIEQLMTHLLGITKANGFNFNVRHVVRERRIPEDCDETVTVYLMFDKTETDINYNTFQNKDYATVELWFMLEEAPTTEQTDSYFNAFIGDLYQRIEGDGSTEGTCYQIKDDTYSGNSAMGGYLEVIPDEFEPGYDVAREGLIKGRLKVELTYIYLKSNPYKWDLTDSEVTT